MATKLRGFEGYDFGFALYRNKDTIKAIAAIVAGINVTALVTTGDWSLLAISLGTAVASLVGKLLLDVVDYYFTEIPA